jgi:serine/threonine protein kinase/tetratricopeptide (TPR) repeat protein
MKCPKCQTDNPDTVKFCGECGTNITHPEDAQPSFTKTLETPVEQLTRGTLFADRYEIIEELGKGGMGSVYRVEDTKIREEVALKLIKPEISFDKKTIERFSNELKLARKIVHKNVGRMFELMEDKGTHFITMEYVPGQDLKGLIRQSAPISTARTISIAKQICAGLAEAHNLSVIHRDLKPSNIMIDKQGNARIMDFGIARSLESKGITGAGVIIGTPEYMSPEQVEGKDTDQRSDIYSLGVILYEMLTGRVPFEGDTPFTIGVKHKSEAPRNPKELNSQIPDDLSRVILRCMGKDKEQRYQSAGEVHSELKNIEKGIPTTEKVIPKRKPITSKEITVTFDLKKLFIPALVVIALIILVVVIWQPWSQKETTPIPSDKPSLAIMYFENNTGDESLNHWRKALSDLLIADLSQSKYIMVLSGERLFNILDQLNQLEEKSYSSDILEQVAARGRVGHTLVGDYAKAGDIFRINVMLQDADTGDLIASEGVEGRGEESLFSLVDELTRKIKGHFKLSLEEIASDIDKDVGKITTSSLEALKYYNEARKHHGKGENREAIPFYEKTVAIDPDFAMAYRGMAMAYSNLGYRSERMKYLQKALELSDRAADRERYWIQADYYSSSEKTLDKAIEAYEKLLQLYPDDRKGNNGLGVLYSSLEEWDKAIERYEVLVQKKDENIFGHGNLANTYMAKGWFNKGREVLESYMNNISDIAPIHRNLSNSYIYQGKFDLALTEAEKALALTPTYYRAEVFRGDIYQYMDDLIEAEKAYKRLLVAEEPRAHYRGWRSLAFLYLLQGKFEKAKDHIKQAIAWADNSGQMESKSWCHALLARLHSATGDNEQALKELEESWNTATTSDLTYYQRFNYYLRGMAFVKMRSLDKAQEAAKEFKKRVDEGMNRKEIRFFYDLMGKIEIERKNFSKAIEYINKALALHPYGPLNKPAIILESLALAYYKLENIEMANEEYKKITHLTAGRLYYGDIYAKSFYMLGQIYEEQGDKTKAIEHYDKFLILWKDADPGLPEVADARERVAGLKQN